MDDLTLQMGLVRDQVSWIARRLPPFVEREELVAYGHLGLVEAKQRYDPDQGVPFENYARPRIRGAVYDGLRELSNVGRREYDAVQRQRAERAAQAERVTARPMATGRSARTPDRSPDRIPRSVAGDPEQVAIIRQEHARIRRAVDSLPPFERQVITAAYDLEDQGDSASAFARRTEVHRASVSRWHHAALDRLRHVLSTEEAEQIARRRACNLAARRRFGRATGVDQR